MERRLVWKKAIEINEDFFREIDDIYNIIEEKPQYILDTEDRATYKFSNTDELLKYSFDQNIDKLTIKPHNKEKDRVLIFTIETEGEMFSYENYYSVCNIYYEIEEEKDYILKERICKLYKKHIKSDWLIGKVGLKSFLYAIVLFLVINFFMGNPQLNKDLNIAEAIVRFILSGTATFLSLCTINLVDLIITYTFFNPIVYNMGFLSKKYNSKKQLKSNIFWGIIVSTGISLIFTMIK